MVAMVVRKSALMKQRAREDDASYGSLEERSTTIRKSRTSLSGGGKPKGMV